MIRRSGREDDVESHVKKPHLLEDMRYKAIPHFSKFEVWVWQV
jgi:hypothetical protein